MISEDVALVSLGSAVMDTERCRSLYGGDGSHADRAYSTRLYCEDVWEPLAVADAPSASDPLSGRSVTRFPVADELAERVGREIFGEPECVEPQTDEVSQGLADDITASLGQLLGIAGRIEVRRRLKPIASLPAKAITTGRTTDGLHLDAPQPGRIFRLGINLGPASRYVICALSSLVELASVLGTHEPDQSVTHAAIYDYARLIDRGVRVVRFEVAPACGWMMQTEKVLHDGRRAHPQLPSRFVLMEAEVIA